MEVPLALVSTVPTSGARRCSISTKVTSVMMTLSARMGTAGRTVPNIGYFRLSDTAGGPVNRVTSVSTNLNATTMRTVAKIISWTGIAAAPRGIAKIMHRTVKASKVIIALGEAAVKG